MSRGCVREESWIPAEVDYIKKMANAVVIDPENAIIKGRRAFRIVVQ